MTIWLVHTSVFCALLSVPSLDENIAEIFEEFDAFLSGGDELMLPMATIMKTGDHISDIREDGIREDRAKKFVQQVKSALTNTIKGKIRGGWTVPYPLLSNQDLLKYLDSFPRWAHLGITLTNLSIAQEVVYQRKRQSNEDIEIWYDTSNDEISKDIESMRGLYQGIEN